MTGLIPDYSKISPRRRMALYYFLEYMGVKVSSPDDIPPRTIYACRLIKTRDLLSSTIIHKIHSGFTYQQVCRKYKVTLREVRTIVSAYRRLENDTHE